MLKAFYIAQDVYCMHTYNYDLLLYQEVLVKYIIYNVARYFCSCLPCCTGHHAARLYPTADKLLA